MTPPCEDNVCILHQSGPDGCDISDQVCKSFPRSSERGTIKFWEYLEVPGEEVYNIIVLKEKCIFQDGQPHCAHLIGKWTRGLQKTTIAVIDSH